MPIRLSCSRYAQDTVQQMDSQTCTLPGQCPLNLFVGILILVLHIYEYFI